MTREGRVAPFTRGRPISRPSSPRKTVHDAPLDRSRGARMADHRTHLRPLRPAPHPHGDHPDSTSDVRTGRRPRRVREDYDGMNRQTLLDLDALVGQSVTVTLP